MKQLRCSPGDGDISVIEVPCPQLAPGCVLVQNRASLVSAGTERMVVEFARKSLLEKARSRPDLVQQVVSKARRDGALTAFRAARNRLDRPTPLGYGSAGVILEAAADITDLKPGDAVACAGAGYAAHAEVVRVPRNLVVKIPQFRPARAEPMDFEEAAFATLGAIAMHGVRLGEAQIGESVAVIGLGLIGLLTVQLARAAGCTVFGMDPDVGRCQLAQQLGCGGTAVGESEFRTLMAARTESIGADVVILAAATPSQEPVRLAGEVARGRGRVVAVGAVGTSLPRDLYYQKELDFRISRSYGPGRYDPEYEEQGQDYPIAYVRWTENRNLRSFLDLLAQGQVNVRPLVTHRFPIAEARRAYELILGETPEPHLGIVLGYPRECMLSRRIELGGRGNSPRLFPHANKVENLGIGLLGAGNFALGVLVPAIKGIPETHLMGVCAATGVSAQYAAKKFGFQYAATDESHILRDPSVNTVVIATPHHLHAEQVLAALAARKNIFCEKPLCLAEWELAKIVRAYGDVKEARPQLAVGFNRRFAPMARAMKEFLAERKGPLVMHYRVNAGSAPREGWIQDRREGGRIRGEVCHFVDFLGFLAGNPPARVYARRLTNESALADDSAVIFLEFADGSLGTISYAANGDTSFSKERIEVFCGGSAGVIEDFRRLELVRNGRRKTAGSRLTQDKGHRAEWSAFAAGLKTGKPPIPFGEIVATTLATFRISDSLQGEEPFEVGVRNFIASALSRTSEEIAAHPPAREVQFSEPF